MFVVLSKEVGVDPTLLVNHHLLRLELVQLQLDPLSNRGSQFVGSNIGV